NEIVSILNLLNLKNQTTLITITHDSRCAKTLCDRAIIIKDKKIHTIGGKDLVDQFFLDK
ncbi:MAG: hypothetical protein ACRC4L_02570, partial [Mycoplasma sp.]